MGYPPLGKQIVEDAAFCAGLLQRLKIEDTEENKFVFMRLAVAIDMMGIAAARRVDRNETEKLRRDAAMHASLVPVTLPQQRV